MIYILSLSFQITGALILLQWSAINFDDKVLDMCFPPTASRAPVDENGIMFLDGRALRMQARKLLLNSFAFLDITVGYILSIWGNKNYSNIEITFFVCIITVILLIIEFIFSARRARHKYPLDFIPYAKLSNKYRAVTKHNQQVNK